MSLDIHSAHSADPTEPPASDVIGLHPDWGERIVTIVAASIAVLIVALIAVLMGMA